MQQTAIITGAAGNLGHSVTRELLANQFQVIGTQLPEENLNEFSQKDNFKAYTVNVADEKACEEFIKDITDQYNEINVAALLAGGFGMGTIENSSLKDIYKMFEINFETAYVSARAIFRQMVTQKSGGHIIMISGKPALEPEAGKGTLGYALSKSLILKLAEMLNAEGKEKNIRASVLVPSIMDTPPNRKAMPNANFEDWVKPEEVASAIGYLSSDKAKSFRETVLKIYGNS